MAFKINNETAFSAEGLTLPIKNSGSLPENPVKGQVIFNRDNNRLEIYDGEWKAIDDVRRQNFLTRQIITTGYVMGGYQTNTPWRNVNRMNHATDVCTNLGDQLDVASAYSSGACNLTKGFMWNANGTVTGSNRQVQAFNMATETTAGMEYQWYLYSNHDDPGTIFKEHQYAFIIGGGSSVIDQFNLTTEIIMAHTSLSDLGSPTASTFTTDTGTGAISGETHGYVYGGTGAKFVFATGTAYHVEGGDILFRENTKVDGIKYKPIRVKVVEGSTESTVFNTSGQQKGISSKIGKGYFGNEGTYNGGYNLRRINFATDTNLGNVAKPIGNSGEENLDMGQDHQYMMGMYDGAQNNRGWKFHYSVDQGWELGAGSTRTGIAGSSSGVCCWKG